MWICPFLICRQWGTWDSGLLPHLDHQLVHFSEVMGFPGSSAGKIFSCNAGNPSSIPWSERIPWKRDRLCTPVFLGFPGGSDGKESAATRKTWVRSLGQEDPLEKEMATHSSVLAWRIPWTEEPGGLQSVGSQRVGHNLATKQKQEARIVQRVPLCPAILPPVVPIVNSPH